MDRVALGTVASVKSGFAFKSKDWKESGVPVIKIANVKDGFVTLEGCSFVDEDVAKCAVAFELRPGDILISMTGYIGEVARVRNEGRMLLNQRVGKFNIKRGAPLDGDFLYHCLRDPELKANFVAHAYGAAQPNISPTLIEQQEIPFPPPPDPAADRGDPVGLRRADREQPAAHHDSRVDGPRPLPRVVRPLPLPRP